MSDADIRNQIEENNRVLRAAIDALEEIKGKVQKKYLSTKEAAEFTSVAVTTLRKDRDKIGYIMRGKNMYFRVSDLIEYMESGLVKPSENPLLTRYFRKGKRS